MNLDRIQMQGKLVGLKERRDKLVLKMEGLCESIRTGLNTMVLGIDGLNVALAANQMEDLERANIDYLDVVTQIQRLERALNG